MKFIQKTINFGAGEPFPNDKLWRYMDFPKFISLLNKKALFFTRADKFEDPLEGLFPKNSSSDNNHKMIKLFYELNRKWVCISCWHLNEFESAAMWSLYSNKDQGIAIQTTFNRFKSSFLDINQLRPQIGKVEYVDIEKGKMSVQEGLERDVLDSFTIKRPSFAHEQEVRAIITAAPIEELHEDGTPVIDQTLEPFAFGAEMYVDLERLIENIYLSPYAPLWHQEIMLSILEKYNLKIPVLKSKIYDISLR
jgi:hypothetical protein